MALENLQILKNHLKNCPGLFRGLIEKYGNNLRVSGTFKRNNQHSEKCQDGETILKVDIVGLHNNYIGDYKEIFEKGEIIQSFNNIPIQEYVKTINTSSIFYKDSFNAFITSL